MNLKTLLLAIVLLEATGCGGGIESTAEVSELTGQEKLEATLQDSGLTLCEAYAWIGRMEAETRKLADARTGMTALEREQYLEGIRDKAWTEYRTFAKLPDSLRVQINGYGMTACE